jgi:hypothetical protein
MSVVRRSPWARNTPRSSSTAVILASFIAIVIAVLGCVSGRMAPEKLPELPIAFLHWEKKAGLKRAKLFEKASEAAQASPGPFASEREQENELRAYLRAEKSSGLQNQLSKSPGRLNLFWPRTGEIERVEAAPSGSMPLAWSSDHKRLLFASGHRGDREQLYEYHLERRDLRRITTESAEHPRGDYGRRGQVVVQRMRRFDPRGKSEMTVHLADASGRLGPAIAQGIPPGTLRLTPDGSRLVYEQVRLRPRRGGPTIFESMIATWMLDQGAGEKLLVKGREPTLTPDGEWIVFASASSAGYRLRRMRPDGTSRVPISPGGTEERMPTVSPDGEYVAFVSMANGKRVLAVRRFDGKGERTLFSKGWSEFPVW